MLTDTTISHADEEDEGLFEDDEEDETDIVMGTEADITNVDKKMLETGDDYLPTRDADNLLRASLDNTDFEDEELNEGSFGNERSGRDLDTEDTLRASGSIQQTDEENKNFSIGSDENDSNENRSV